MTPPVPSAPPRLGAVVAELTSIADAEETWRQSITPQSRVAAGNRTRHTDIICRIGGRGHVDQLNRTGLFK